MTAATSVRAALTLAAAGLVATLAASRSRRVVALDVDLRPARHWPEPHLVIEARPADGPVLVTVEYRVPPGNAAAFRKAMRPVERARRRTGARRWSLFQDGADPARFLETYVVATWEEHLRQHDERFTVRDSELEAHARALVEPGSEPVVGHLLSTYRDENGAGRLVQRVRGPS